MPPLLFVNVKRKLKVNSSNSPQVHPFMARKISPTLDTILALLRQAPEGLAPSDIEAGLEAKGQTVPSRPTLIKYMEALAKEHPVGKAGQGRSTRYHYYTNGVPDEAVVGGTKNAPVATAVPAAPVTPGKTTLVLGENLDWLRAQPDGSFDLIYVDPPFNTGKTQKRTNTKAVVSDEAGNVGFGGRRYARQATGKTLSYQDKFDDFITEFLAPRMEEAFRLLSPTGSLFLHLDPRESHYAKVFLDGLFGRDCFRNEIIWSYDYGARSRDHWSTKHDTILWYSKHPKQWTFNYDAIDRIPYMAPGLVGEEKAARGKTPTDVWWNTIVSPTGKEKTGYPTQKPLAILERIVAVHSNPQDRLLDFCAGSGSFGHAAAKQGRDCVLVDKNPEAREVIIERFKKAGLVLTEGVVKKDNKA